MLTGNECYTINIVCVIVAMFLSWALNNKYLLLTEFEVRTVSYRPSFFPLIYDFSR